MMLGGKLLQIFAQELVADWLAASCAEIGEQHCANVSSGGSTRGFSKTALGFAFLDGMPLRGIYVPSQLTR